MIRVLSYHHRLSLTSCTCNPAESLHTSSPPKSGDRAPVDPAQVPQSTFKTPIISQAFNTRVLGGANVRTSIHIFTSSFTVRRRASIPHVLHAAAWLPIRQIGTALARRTTASRSPGRGRCSFPRHCASLPRDEQDMPKVWSK